MTFCNALSLPVNPAAGTAHHVHAVLGTAAAQCDDAVAQEVVSRVQVVVIVKHHKDIAERIVRVGTAQSVAARPEPALAESVHVDLRSPEGVFTRGDQRVHAAQDALDTLTVLR